MSSNLHLIPPKPPDIKRNFASFFVKPTSSLKNDEIRYGCGNVSSSSVSQFGLGIPFVMPPLVSQISSYGQLPIIIPSLTQVPSVSQIPSNVSFSSISHSSMVDKDQVPLVSESFVPSIDLPHTMNPVLASAAIPKPAKRVVYNNGEPVAQEELIGGNNKREWQVVKGKGVTSKESRSIRGSSPLQIDGNMFNLLRGNHSGKDDHKEAGRVILNEKSVFEGGKKLSKSAGLNVEKEGFSANEGVVFPVDPIQITEDVIGDILDGIIERVVEDGNLFVPDQMVRNGVSGEIQFVSLSPINDPAKVGSLALVGDLSVGNGQRGCQDGGSGNAVGGIEHCFSPSKASFYLERFTKSKSAASISLDDERGLVRIREPPDKGYFFDTSTLKSKDLLGKIVEDSEGSKSDSTSVEFSSAEVEMRV
ncbi:unnamed protein product [Ilex paraguariensis]|uniref:Uncharacterized protein n=1 Tax=Ilex paraguariensis TaxID=185542 RepID=A0ABC8SZ43_9AQUA